MRHLIGVFQSLSSLSPVQLTKATLTSIAIDFRTFIGIVANVCSRESIRVQALPQGFGLLFPPGLNCFGGLARLVSEQFDQQQLRLIDLGSQPGEIPQNSL